MNSAIIRITAIAALVPAAIVSLATAANARTGHINGYTVEVVDSGSYSAPDFITLYGPNGKEQITVTCAPFSWTSYGANSETFVDGIARSWCF